MNSERCKRSSCRLLQHTEASESETRVWDEHHWIGGAHRGEKESNWWVAGAGCMDMVQRHGVVIAWQGW